MSQETKTVTFDLDYQGASYASRYFGFVRVGDLIRFHVAGAPTSVLVSADEIEALCANLMAAAEGIRRGDAGRTVLEAGAT